MENDAIQVFVKFDNNTIPVTVDKHGSVGDIR